MEKCVNYECEANRIGGDNNCGALFNLANCEIDEQEIEEYAEISVDELTEMREKLDRQTAFIEALVGAIPDKEDLKCEDLRCEYHDHNMIGSCSGYEDITNCGSPKISGYIKKQEAFIGYVVSKIPVEEKNDESK